MTLVSLIMPVYNVSQYVEQAIKSVISQTYTEWELIIIDDGSTDDTGKICDYYSKIDPRVICYHQQNRGVAMARQYGVNHAKGKYSIHIDGDDWIDSQMLEKMLNEAEFNNYDIVIANYFVNNKNNVEIHKQRPTSTNPELLLKDIFKGNIFGGLCNKIIRHKLYKQYHALFFDGINYCEDVLILVQLLQNRNLNIGFIHEAFYHYRTNDDSITHSITLNTYNLLLKYEEKLNEILPQDKFKECRERLRLGLLCGGFKNKFLSDKDVKKTFWKSTLLFIKYQRSGSWWLCFILIIAGYPQIAHKFAK